MLLQLQKSISGFKLEAPLKGGPKNILFEATNEALESFVDDTEIIITSDEDFKVVDKIISEFENLSGAILNRSEKTKVMGLGAWAKRTIWPLEWVKVVKEMKIFGIKVCADFPQILDLNWEFQLNKLKSMLISWNTRALDSVFARAQVLSIFGLSKLYFRAQILPLPNAWAKLYESEIRKFL